jgi:hypothetical protein
VPVLLQRVSSGPFDSGQPPSYSPRFAGRRFRVSAIMLAQPLRSNVNMLPDNNSPDLPALRISLVSNFDLMSNQARVF